MHIHVSLYNKNLTDKKSCPTYVVLILLLTIVHFINNQGSHSLEKLGEDYCNKFFLYLYNGSSYLTIKQFREHSLFCGLSL